MQRPSSWRALGNQEELQDLCDWRAGSGWDPGEGTGARLWRASNTTLRIWVFIPPAGDQWRVVSIGQRAGSRLDVIRSVSKLVLRPQEGG